MAKVNWEDVRKTILEAGKKVDALLKLEEKSFFFDIREFSFCTDLCEEDGSDEDENLEVRLGVCWSDAIYPNADGEKAELSLYPRDIISSDYIAGYLMSFIDAHEERLYGGRS